MKKLKNGKTHPWKARWNPVTPRSGDKPEFNDERAKGAGKSNRFR